MQNKEIILSNGDKIILKPFCSRKLFKEIQRKTWGTNSEILGGKFENAKIDILAMTDAEDFAVFSLIEKVFDSQGKEMAVDISYVENLPMIDFKEIKIAVDNIMGENQEEKKG